MKLIVQIPCYNEEHTLPQTVADIPNEIPGIDEIEVLIIDDGSTDRTVEVAQALGVQHIVRNKRNQGLARTFRHGLEAAISAGADIVVNTDGDNQYAGADIAKLIQPILDGNADIVIGDRQTSTIEHFSKSKKILQWLGSGIVRRLAGIWVPDAVSGFRAFTREAAIKLNIVSSFSYTIETVIQAGKRGMTVTSIPVRTNAKTRESRLFTSVPKFIERQLGTVIRVYAMYQPLRVFFIIGAFLIVLGFLPIARFLYFYFVADSGGGHLQSLLLGSIIMLVGFMTLVVGLVADLISFNRQMLEMILERVKRLELAAGRQTGDED